MSAGFITFPGVWLIGTPITPQWCSSVQDSINQIYSGTFNANVTISGSLTVSGSTKLLGGVFISGTSDIAQIKNLNVIGSSTLGPLTASSYLALNDSRIQGQLTTNGDITSVGVIYSLSRLMTSGSVLNETTPLRGGVYLDMQCLAWGDIGNNGTITVNNQRGVTSVTRSATGLTTVTMRVACSGAAYAPTVTLNGTAGFYSVTKTGNATFQIQTLNTSNTAADIPYFFHVFGSY